MQTFPINEMWCWTACKSFANFCPLFANLFYHYFGQCGKLHDDNMYKERAAFSTQRRLQDSSSSSTQVTSLARDYATCLDTLPLEVARFPSSPLIITVPFFIFFLLIRFSLRAILGRSVALIAPAPGSVLQGCLGSIIILHLRSRPLNANANKASPLVILLPQTLGFGV